MNRGLFSLFHWTLRNDARVLSTHILRAIFCILLLLGMTVAGMRTAIIGAAGLEFFRSICWLNVGLITIASISYFSTVVTEETEAETLGLLKLAGMGAFSILLGKSISRLIGALMLLLVQFPFTLLAITLGGITLRQLLGCYIALGAYLILVANVAMFFSVFCRTSTRAAAMTALLVMTSYCSLPVMNFVLANSTSVAGTATTTFREAYEKTSLFYRIDECLQANFSGSIFGLQAAASVAVGTLLFVLACIGFEYASHRNMQPARAPSVGQGGSRLRRLGVSRTWKLSLAWKTFYFLTGGRLLWLIRVFGFGGLFYILKTLTTGPRGGDLEETGLWMACIMACFLMLETCVYASRFLFDEVRWKTATGLLILPMTPRQLVLQKVLGCVLAILPTVAWLTVSFVLAYDECIRIVVSAEFIYLFQNYVLLLHCTALLSLRLKWAALPVAAVVVVAFNSCCPIMAVGYTIGSVVGVTYRNGGWMLFAGSLLLYWLLVLFPIELETIHRFALKGEEDQ